jgi:hypothetical protein
MTESRNPVRPGGFLSAIVADSRALMPRWPDLSDRSGGGPPEFEIDRSLGPPQDLNRLGAQGTLPPDGASAVPGFAHPTVPRKPIDQHGTASAEPAAANAAPRKAAIPARLGDFEAGATIGSEQESVGCRVAQPGRDRGTESSNARTNRISRAHRMEPDPTGIGQAQEDVRHRGAPPRDAPTPSQDFARRRGVARNRVVARVGRAAVRDHTAGTNTLAPASPADDERGSASAPEAAAPQSPPRSDQARAAARRPQTGAHAGRPRLDAAGQEPAVTRPPAPTVHIGTLDIRIESPKQRPEPAPRQPVTFRGSGVLSRLYLRRV